MSETAGRSIRPSTLFAGDSSPEAIARRRRAQIGALVAFFFISPLTFLSALGTWLAFSWGRISWKVTSSIAVILVALSGVTFLADDIFMLYINAWKNIVMSVADDPSLATFGKSLPLFMLQQLPASIIIGTVLGSIYSAWAWYRRPVWENREFRLTPVEWYFKRRNIKDIQLGNRSPENGATLGISPRGKKIIQEDSAASAHTFIVGASGSGKTTTMMLEARDIIRRGHSLVFIDLKGGQDVPAILYDYAQRYNRPFKHWLIHPFRSKYLGPAPEGPAYYDPIGRGDATRRKDLLIEGRKWTEEYYKILAASYLQTALDVAISVPVADKNSLEDVIDLLNPSNLRKRALSLPTSEEYDLLRNDVDRWVNEKLKPAEHSAISGMRDELQAIRSSVAGEWLTRDPNKEKAQKTRDINLKKAAHEGEIIVFSLDASNYEGLSKLIANLIIQDLKTVTSELRQDPSRNPIHIFIDEFAAAGSDNVIGLINKSRDAKMPVTLATQALADLKKADDAFLDQMIGIVNCFIIHRANSDKDGEIYAGLTGKEKRWTMRYGIEHSSGLFGGVGTGAGTGQGHAEVKEDFRVSASEIQDLQRGEMIYLAKSPQLTIERVLVIPEEGKLGESDGNTRVRVDMGIPVPVKTTESIEQEAKSDILSFRKDEEVSFLEATDEYSFEKIPTKAPKNITPPARRADPEALNRIFHSKEWEESSEESSIDLHKQTKQDISSTTVSKANPKVPSRPARPTLPTRPARPSAQKNQDTKAVEEPVDPSLSVEEKPKNEKDNYAW